MCDHEEKKQGDEGYESFHANSINAVWPKRFTRAILPHVCLRAKDGVGRGACFRAPYASVDRQAMTTCFLSKL